MTLWALAQWRFFDRLRRSPANLQRYTRRPELPEYQMLYAAPALASLPIATAANPFGCAPNSYPNYTDSNGNPIPPPPGRQFCSNVLGNSGRNSFYGPKLTDVDVSIFKNTKIPRISEAFNLQLRAEFFNVLNHTNCRSPGFLIPLDKTTLPSISTAARCLQR
jgi:hypothetical protein